MKKVRIKNIGIMFHKPLSKIQDGLYLGDVVDASNKETLMKHGIKYVLNVTRECPSFHPNDFVYKRIDVYDMEKSDLLERFFEISEFIKEGKAAGGVFVHCAYGISRSSTSIIAYLMKEQGFTYGGGRSYVEKRRPIIYPNHGFVRQLKKWERLIKSNQLVNKKEPNDFGKTGMKDNFEMNELYVTGKKGFSSTNDNFNRLRGKSVGLKAPSLPKQLERNKASECSTNNYFGKFNNFFGKIIEDFDGEYENDTNPSFHNRKSKFGSITLQKDEPQSSTAVPSKTNNFTIKSNNGLNKFTN